LDIVDVKMNSKMKKTRSI